MQRPSLAPLPRPSTTVVLRLVLVLRDGCDCGIEVERREPPPGVDEMRVEVAGAGNQHGHHHAEVLARYAGALLYRTDEHGDVTLRSDGTRLWAQSAR